MIRGFRNGWSAIFIIASNSILIPMSSCRFDTFLKYSLPCIFPKKLVWCWGLVMRFAHCMMIISTMLKCLSYFRSKLGFVSGWFRFNYGFWFCVVVYGFILIREK